MAYILEIKERNIDTKTNLKPFQNQKKTNSKMKFKQYSFKLESKNSRSMNMLIKNFIPLNIFLIKRLCG